MERFRWHVFGAFFAVTAAVIIGCGPAKELPDAIPKSDETDEKAIPVPAASEPAATEYLAKAVKAYTSGKPELVAKGKSSRLVLRGTMLYLVDNQKLPVETTRTIAAVWPNRFAGVNDFQVRGAKATVSVWLRRPQFTIMNGNEEFTPPNRAESEQNFAADDIAQHWMALFLPQTDPNAIVFDLRKQIVHQQSVQTLKLALGSFPLYQLYFDATNDSLLRVEYTITEQGVQRRRQWTMAEHKPGPDELRLPGKMECRYDNIVVEEWVAEKWEFPKSIDEAEFNPPKK